jgi:hypothetical protein
MRSDHHLFSSEMAGGGPMTLTFVQPFGEVGRDVRRAIV